MKRLHIPTKPVAAILAGAFSLTSVVIAAERARGRRAEILTAASNKKAVAGYNTQTYKMRLLPLP